MSQEDHIRILLVEDNPGDVDLIREVLTEKVNVAFHLTSVRSMAELSTHLPQNQTDVILLDLTLPDCFGLETLERAVKMAPDLPIVVLTGFEDETLGFSAVQHGAQDYLIKGRVEGDILSRAIRYAIERKRAEQSIHEMAYYDSLTKLPNRTLFFDRLKHALIQAQRNKQMAAILFLDLDHFKAVNDTLGHDVGDYLLKEVGRRLPSCVRAIDTVSRLGGDEFTLLLPEISRVEDATVIVGKIFNVLKPPVVVRGQELFVSTSIGISLYPNDGKDADTLIQHADLAMYRAKQRGANGFEFYSPSMNLRISDRLGMRNALARALERGEFLLHYQPRVHLKSGRITGAEALIRWRNPKLGVVPPSEFIPVAEETGLIIPIGEWVLRNASRQARAWQLEGFTRFRVAVNLSSRQFNQQDLPASVLSILRETDLDPEFLELELTESEVMSNPKIALIMLEEFSQMGIHLAIDDFGTGYSSLNRLKSLPIGTVKIDQSFVRQIPDDLDDAAIVCAIISLAKNLKMKVIAEGVEKKEQLTFFAR